MMAVRCSVTVSIAADTTGIFSETFLLNLVWIFTSLGKISEYCGTKSTSSKVSAFLIIFIVYPFIKFSKLNAPSSTLCSSHALPISCADTLKFSLTFATGTEIAGSPARFTLIV